jgi:hypothetical protein
MQVTISYPAPYEGRVEETFEWEQGKPLRDYLREKRLLARNLRCRTTRADGEKVRMNYIPTPGETIKLAFV